MLSALLHLQDGSISIAVDAIRAAAASHTFLSVNKQGLSAIVETEGNDATHVILRGSNTGPNYAAEHVSSVADKLAKAGLVQKVMIDCSHGNSSKKHENQILVAEDIARQLSEGETSNKIMGVMLESNLVEGRQNVPAEGPAALAYGVSVTDGEDFPPSCFRSNPMILALTHPNPVCFCLCQPACRGRRPFPASMHSRPESEPAEPRSPRSALRPDPAVGQAASTERPSSRETSASPVRRCLVSPLEGSSLARRRIV